MATRRPSATYYVNAESGSKRAKKGTQFSRIQADVEGYNPTKRPAFSGSLGQRWTSRTTLWRPGSESNRRTRLCRPLHDHSATWPVTCRMSLPAGTELSCVPEKTKTSADRGSWCNGLGFFRWKLYSRFRGELYSSWRWRLYGTFEFGCTALARRRGQHENLGVEPNVERETRLELATPTLARSCSTN